jgi:hypothetical protein
LRLQILYKMTRRSLFLLLLLGTIHLGACAQQTHQLDTKQSKILWKTPMGGHKGYLLFTSGSLSYSASGQPLTGSFRMDMTSIRVTDSTSAKNIEKSEATIRTKDFFAVGQYPAATIVTTKISRIPGSQAYTVNGDLTIKGITHAIEFTANIDKKDNSTHITAQIGILRHLWNIDFKPKNSIDMITGLTGKIDGDDIYVTLDLLLNK